MCIVLRHLRQFWRVTVGPTVQLTQDLWRSLETFTVLTIKRVLERLFGFRGCFLLAYLSQPRGRDWMLYFAFSLSCCFSLSRPFLYRPRCLYDFNSPNLIPSSETVESKRWPWTGSAIEPESISFQWTRKKSSFGLSVTSRSTAWRLSLLPRF